MPSPFQIKQRLVSQQSLSSFLAHMVHTLTSPKRLYSQKLHYDQRTKQPAFAVGNPVWLSIPTAGKLDPRWEGEWVIKSMKSPITAEICDGRRTRVVHTNRLQRRFIPGQLDTAELDDINNRHECTDWAPPSVDHIVLSPAEQTVTPRYPQRNRRPPEYYRP